jgi:hypothetical protein
MTDQQYFNQVAAALKAVNDAAAKYLQKNPNAKYKDASGIDRPISLALDVSRKHAKMLTDVPEPPKE